MDQNWKDFTRQIVTDLCNEQGSRTFTLQTLKEAKERDIISFSANNNHPFDKIRQQLQFLREDGFLSFVDNRGTYTLKDVVLKDELSDDTIAAAHPKDPEKREYTREIYARDRGWVKQAKDKLGHFCLHPNCCNTFKKKDGEPYIEVHHIIPLFEDGEDAIWNLVVVCAHHHKMAHFADTDTQMELRKLFLKIIEKKL